MYNPDNVFAKIIKNELPCSTVYEDDNILAFYDINPAAPIHILVIPKGNYVSFDDFVINHHDVGGFFLKVHEIAKMKNLDKDGYRIVTNIGKNGGQEIAHFHVHILGGKKLSGI